jgi:hypothetical protein
MKSNSKGLLRLSEMVELAPERFEDNIPVLLLRFLLLLIL